jgi:hypothetical protein
MRKISKIRSSDLDRTAREGYVENSRPLRIPGATITSWSAAPDINLDALFARPIPGATIAGAAARATDRPEPPAPEPVWMSDQALPRGQARSADRAHPADRVGEPNATFAADPASAPDQPIKGTVSLSDGTRITFATKSQFDIVGLV